MMVIEKTLWRVLIIFGSPGVEISTISQGVQEGIEKTKTDSAAQSQSVRVVTTYNHIISPNHYLGETAHDSISVEGVTRRFTAAAEQIGSAIRIIIANHLIVPGTEALIIASDCIMPHLVDPRRLSDLNEFKGIPILESLKSIFIQEKDKRKIQGYLSNKHPPFQQLHSHSQSRIVEAIWRLNHDTAEQAMALGLHVVPANPYRTAVMKILNLIDASDPVK